MSFRLFVVDDDPHYARLLSYRLRRHEAYEVEVFERGEAVLEHLSDGPDLVLLDIMMPGMGGMQTLEEIQRRRPELPVVMVSAQGAIETAVEAMKKGAYDYITKGQDDMVKLEVVVQNVLEKVSMERELVTLRTEVAEQYSFDELIGESPAMQEVYRLIRKSLRGNLTVAIQGESGTGKELVARAIHYNSPRCEEPFVVVNCAAIPRDLMESAFFGHEKGAFTGAHQRQIGKFEQADGGTIFLDEIGELDLDLQAKLLRALQSYEIQRVGGTETIRFDARVISATNRNVRQMIQEGAFREDLYYRLFQFPIPLPPLRERGKDVLLLARHFLTSYIEEHAELEEKALSAAARRAILDYRWPGNVRQLKSAVERAVLVAEGDVIEPADLMLEEEHVAGLPPGAAQHNGTGTRTAAGEALNGLAAVQGDGDVATIEELKRQAVARAYEIFGGDVEEAAEALGIGRATMYRLIKKYGVREAE